MYMYVSMYMYLRALDTDVGLWHVIFWEESEADSVLPHTTLSTQHHQTIILHTHTHV